MHLDADNPNLRIIGLLMGLMLIYESAEGAQFKVLVMLI